MKTHQLISKQSKFLLAEIPSNTCCLSKSGSTEFRGGHYVSPLTMMEMNDVYLAFGAHVYNKSPTDTSLDVKADRLITHTKTEVHQAISC